MGRGIARVALKHGFGVAIFDVNVDAVRQVAAATAGALIVAGSVADALDGVEAVDRVLGLAFRLAPEGRFETFRKHFEAFRHTKERLATGQPPGSVNGRSCEHLGNPMIVT